MGDVFEIEFQINHNNASVPICEGTIYVNKFYSENISFISFDGENWTDLYDYNWNNEGENALQVACIKAFTVLNNETFTMLSHQIENHENYLELTNDYAYTDIDEKFANGITISKDNFIIDGKGHTIDGAGLARIFNIIANNVTLKNINFINGCCEFAGAIVCEDGNLTITDCNFTSNKATAEEGVAGAIGFDGDSLTIKNSKFTNNIANNESSNSGAILFNGNNLNIMQSEFINNYAQSEGVMYAVGDTVTIYKSRFENNKAESGIIAIISDNSFIDECEFINNSAKVYVGVSNIEGTMTINNSYFANNTAETSTRLIRNSQSYTLIISNCVFKNNIGNEGNYSIDNNYGTIYLHNNTINTQSSEIHNYGGNINSPCTAIALENKTIPVAVGEKTTLTAIITDDNGNLIEEAYYVYFKINDESIESTYNSQTSRYEVEYTFYTASLVPIDIACPSINITVKQGTCDVRHNTYIDLINEINNCQDNTFVLTKDYIYNPLNDSSYTSGIVINKTDFTVDGQGHTIDGAGLARIFNITANNITLKNINFINGYCEFGGAINCENCDLTIIRCNFTNNKASEKGGALYLKESSVNVVNTSFTQNNAPTGGSIYIEVGALNIDNSTFAENQAFEAGSIYNEEIGVITIRNTKFASNTAKYGGAIRNEQGSLTITDDEFTGNHADYNGGAVYNSGFVDISNSKFANNTAQYGGAINNYDHDMIISNTQFANNTAAEYGGAINNENGGLEIESTNFTQNTARYGGAIENRYQLNIDNCRLESNNAHYGGAIDNDMGEAIIENTQFKNNTASRYGGAVYNDNGKTSITNTGFTQNTARYGGAVASENGEMEITNANFTKNTAEQHGGAVHTLDGDTTIANANFTNNTAGQYGGAIDNGGKTTITNAQFTNNKADTAGAIETSSDMTISNAEFIGNGEDCIEVDYDAKITLDNVTSDVQLVNDEIGIEILEAKDVVYGNDINIKVKVESSAITPLNSGKVVVKVNNIEYSADVKDGIATLIIPKLNAGTYNANVTYIDNNMSRAEIPVNFTVNKKDITINTKDAAYVINYGGTYKASFTNVADGTKVTFTLNGKNIATSTIKNGSASIKLTAKILKTAKAGTKNMAIKIENSNYSPIIKTVKITINKEKTKITAKKKTFKRTAKTKKYTIALKNSKGKAMKKARVTIKVKGKTYKAKTNSKGKATFKITKLTKKGTYKAVIKYKGSSYYKNVTKKVKIRVK